MMSQGLMNDHKSEEQGKSGVNGSAALASDGEGGQSFSTQSEAAVEPDPFKVLEALQAENAELKDRSLRVLAEMENLRRRTEREVGDAKAYGVTSFARDMLTFADNLRRAIDAVPAEAREAADPALRSFIEGIDLTERDFLSRLVRFGVKRMEPMGKKFDPNHHEVLFEVPDESIPAGTITQVIEQGYTIGDRVLRAAKVGVARGGPKG
jgi:molecular chaperone GrpE